MDLLHCGQLKRQCGTQLSLVSLTLRSAYTIRTLSGSQLTDSYAPCAVPQDRRLHAATAGRRDRRQPPADRLLRGRVEPPTPACSSRWHRRSTSAPTHCWAFNKPASQPGSARAWNAASSRSSACQPSQSSSYSASSTRSSPRISRRRPQRCKRQGPQRCGPCASWTIKKVKLEPLLGNYG